MHDIVINTGPIIALVAATESLEWLPSFESFSDCIIRMSERGIWISEDLVQSSLQQAGEA